MTLISELNSVLGKNIVTSKSEMKPFSKDESGIIGEMPLAVVMPSNTKQVSQIMAICSKNKVHVTVRGGGSSLTGSSVPKGKSIVIDMSKFKKIIKTNIEDRYIVVEPDLTLDQVNKHLLKYKFFYPPLPASSAIATVGGSISTNAGGMRAVTYGATKDWILGLEFVLANGKVIRSGGRVLKHSTGYDLTSLMVGSEGTLGVITQATLKIWPIPESTGMILADYSKIEDAARATGELKKSGITPITAEFLDESSLKLIKEAQNISIDENVKCMLLVTLSSTKEAVPALLRHAEIILKKNKAINIVNMKDVSRFEKLFNARKEFFNTTLAEAKSSNKRLIIADAVVPTSQLSSVLLEVRRSIKKSGLDGFLFGHMGDGNIHVNILYRIGSKSDKKKVDSLQREIARIAIKHEGSISGEHGIGLLKKELLKEELKARGSLESLAVMKKIKKALDPDYILNKSKIFD